MKLWIWLAGVFVVIMVLAALWGRYLHPSIRQATEAKIRAVVPANLLPSGARPDPAAVGRLDQLVQICQRMKLPYVKTDAANVRNVRANRSLAVAAMGLVRQGPLAVSGDDYRLLSAFWLFSRDLAQQAKLAAKSGDSAASERSIEDGLDLAAAIRSAGGAIIGYLVYETMDAIAIENAADCIRSGWLKPADLRKLIGAVKQYGLDDEDLKADYRQELQRNLFDKVSGLVAIGKGLREHRGQSEDVPQIGNFDAVETATMLAKVYGEWTENASRRWGSQVNTEAERVDALAKTLPEDPESPMASTSLSPGLAPPPPSDLEKLEYRMKMNTIPNSVGIALTADFGDLGSSSRGNSIKASCFHEMLRALAAVWAYKEEHAGKYPGSLALLVAGGYLKQLPIDWFSLKPLLYNPRTHAIYSVGQAMADDGGELVRDVMRTDGNFGLGEQPRTPRPSPAAE